MRKRKYLTLIVLILLYSCAGENKTKDVESPLPVQTYKRVETPGQFKDIVVKAIFTNNFSLLDSLRYRREDYARTFSPSDTMLIHATWKRSFDSLVSSVTIMLEYRDESSFEDVVRAGRKYGVDWSSPSGVRMKKTSGKLYPGYLITVSYAGLNGKYDLTMEADSADKGFLLGSKLELLKN